MLTILAAGKLREPFFIDAAAEYEKRLRAFGGVQIRQLPEVRLPSSPTKEEIFAALRKEAVAFRREIPHGSWVCALAPEGQMMTSEQFAARMQKVRLEGKSSLVFLIGSSFGMDNSLKESADLLLSLSRMTFPHHLARVMLLEQLYRAESILAGMSYHK